MEVWVNHGGKEIKLEPVIICEDVYKDNPPETITIRFGGNNAVTKAEC